MAKPAAEPQPVNEDGSPILPPPSTGAQDPTVVAATVEEQQAAADAALHGHDVAPTHDAAGYELDANGEPIIPDPAPAQVPTDASGNPDAQADNALGDVEAAPEIDGYCHNPECVINSVQLWKPLDEAPVMCQCGQLLHPEPIDAGDEGQVDEQL